MTYLVLYLIGIVSPLLAIGEALAVFCGLSQENLSWWGVGLALALGQTTGFLLLYLFGDVFLARFDWVKRKLGGFDSNKYQGIKWKVTLSAAIFGLPPLNVLAAAGPLYEARRLLFVTLVLLGRVPRFLILAGAPAYFAAHFDPDLLPLWVRELF